MDFTLAGYNGGPKTGALNQLIAGIRSPYRQPEAPPCRPTLECSDPRTLNLLGTLHSCGQGEKCRSA